MLKKGKKTWIASMAIACTGCLCIGLFGCDRQTPLTFEGGKTVYYTTDTEFATEGLRVYYGEKQLAESEYKVDATAVDFSKPGTYVVNVSYITAENEQEKVLSTGSIEIQVVEDTVDFLYVENYRALISTYATSYNGGDYLKVVASYISGKDLDVSSQVNIDTSKVDFGKLGTYDVGISFGGAEADPISISVVDSVAVEASGRIEAESCELSAMTPGATLFGATTVVGQAADASGGMCITNTHSEGNALYYDFVSDTTVSSTLTFTMRATGLMFFDNGIKVVTTPADLSKVLSVYVNGTKVSLTGTTEDGWKDFATTVNLTAGENTLKIVWEEGIGIDIDYFTFSTAIGAFSVAE